jgi:hypothetical protein
MSKSANSPSEARFSGKRILSLGAGVQSTTVLLMSCRGELPALDLAIFADTGWEPRNVYRHLNWLEHEAKQKSYVNPVRVVRVGAANIVFDALNSQVRGTKANGKRWASMPFHVLAPDGSKGMIRRQCTREYKIDPQDTYMRREVLELRPRQHAPKTSQIEQWFGISLDEIQRMRLSAHPWKTHHYPLIFDQRMRRLDCQHWFFKHYPGQHLPRSACIGCPYHSNMEWRALRDFSPDDWQEAVAIDRAMRHAGGMRGKLFLHRDCAPLDEVDLSDAIDYGQTDMFGNECDGMCAT